MSATTPPRAEPPQPSTPRTAHPDELAQLKALFLASLNHEIRTPLSGILGMADLLLETNLDEDQREYVNAVRLCAENLFEILNATLEYSSLEAGKVTLDESEFSLKEMLDAAVNQHAARAKAKGLRLFSTLDAGLPETMIGDAPRVRQLLSHLVANAVKFTHTGSVELSVSIKRAGTGTDWLVAEVRDTGVGIPTEKLETIFESFRQGESGLARSYAGLGLGLALVRKLITLMNGEISVVSTPGVGSTFTMRLPLRPPAETIAASSEGQSQPLATILAVEDNPVGLMVLHRALQRHHIKVDGAPSGRAALEAAAKQRYDLVLMDLQMPEMDGLETATAMRELPGYKTVPILALTANASDELRDVCLQRGMQAFLPKPFDTKVLLAAISKFVKKDA